jgi:glycosyltransferase involved in cell wall biosynthesis
LLTDGADAILIPAGDAEALAGAVRRLASDPALARRLGDEGRATYEAQASEDVLGLRWRDLLERAVARR